MPLRALPLMARFTVRSPLTTEPREIVNRPVSLPGSEAESSSAVIETETFCRSLPLRLRAFYNVDDEFPQRLLSALGLPPWLVVPADGETVSLPQRPVLLLVPNFD